MRFYVCHVEHSVSEFSHNYGGLSSPWNSPVRTIGLEASAARFASARLRDRRSLGAVSGLQPEPDDRPDVLDAPLQGTHPSRCPFLKRRCGGAGRRKAVRTRGVAVTGSH